jgi:outer membrane receptor protein involved in Fe transport
MYTPLFRFLLVFLGITYLVWSQAETGQIAGTVQDATGSVIPNATIKVTNASTGAERSTTSSASGDFSLANLLPGTYNVTVEVSGFSKFQQSVTVTVGARVGLPVKLEVGTTGTTVHVTETAAQINTETQTLSTNVSQAQLRELPTLTRNPYSLVAISGNVSDAGSGDRGVGFSINGQRQASTNVLLDGAANNDEFTGSVGQAVPLDSVQEFSILTNNFTAEFGRASGGVVNVVTKSGTNQVHGTAYEFNRVSALSSNTFDNNANGIAKSTFTRNQFGYSLGGPIKKDKLFAFSSTEWIRIRGVSNTTAVIPTNQLLAAASPNTQSFFNAYGKLKPTTNVLQSYGAGAVCGSSTSCLGNLNPSTPVLQRVAYSSFDDSGGGIPGNQYQTVARVDYNLSDRTQLYGRYALESRTYFAGYISNSPYQGFDTGEQIFNNNALLSVTHTFTPTFVSQSKAVFNRLNDLQPFGTAGANLPTLYTGSSGVARYQGVRIMMPGYSPTTPGSGIPFGGPQNFVQLYEDLSWTHGKHNFRFGGSYDYQRDNRTFGAYQTAGYYLGAGTGSASGTIARLLSGQAYQFQAAIYPQGKLPGQTVNFPLTQPNFSRSNRYNEGAVYVQDSWRIIPRFTLNVGLRWEYYGVQHNKNSALDSNFYDPPNQIDTPLGIRQGQVKLANTAGGLWDPTMTNFAPRLGFAWDLTGDGKTSLRGGWGIGYERNFGNVTFNVIQNPPNYETVSIFNANQPIPISPSNFGPFSQSSGTLTLPKASLRNVDFNIRQAYSHFWSLSLERQLSNRVTFGIDYTGSRGVHLYDIQALNNLGYGNRFLGDPCSTSGAQILANFNDTGSTGCLTYLNGQYTGINRRGDRGWSNYNGLNFRARIDDVAHSGVTLTAAYTWSHALDTLSSTFSDSDDYSNNNGQFTLGYLDAYNSMLDKGSSDFDVRQRVSVAAVWSIPAYKSGKGFLHQALGGWEVAPIFTARTGSPYSLFDGTNGFSYSPRASLLGSVSANGVGDTQPAGTSPNLYNFLNIPNSIINHYVNPQFGFSDIGPFPATMLGRNTFLSPGFWNLDAGVYKTFSLSERFKLQLRGEAYNIVNHANLYVQGTSADLSGAPAGGSGFTSVTACKGCNTTSYRLANDRRNLQLALKLIF